MWLDAWSKSVLFPCSDHLQSLFILCLEFCFSAYYPAAPQPERLWRMSKAFRRSGLGFCGRAAAVAAGPEKQNINISCVLKCTNRMCAFYVLNNHLSFVLFQWHWSTHRPPPPPHKSYIHVKKKKSSGGGVGCSLPPFLICEGRWWNGGLMVTVSMVTPLQQPLPTTSQKIRDVAFILLCQKMRKLKRWKFSHSTKRQTAAERRKENHRRSHFTA